MSPTGTISLMIRIFIPGQNGIAYRSIFSVIRDCAVYTGETERLDKYS